MLILGIESSCDETAAAVVQDGHEVLSSVISSQIKLHAAYGDFAKANGFMVIPVGTAVQLYRKELPVVYTENSFGGDPCGSAKFEQGKDGKWKPKGDVFHFNSEGHYLQALVWTASLFGVDVAKCPYKPDFLDAARAEKMKACAMKAVKGK